MTERRTMSDDLTPEEIETLAQLLTRARRAARRLPAAIGYRLDDALSVLPLLEGK